MGTEPNQKVMHRVCAHDFDTDFNVPLLDHVLSWDRMALSEQFTYSMTGN